MACSLHLMAAAGRELIRIDLDDTSATVTTLGGLPDNTVGIAFGPVQVSAIPTLNIPALLLLVVLVLILTHRSWRAPTGSQKRRQPWRPAR